MREITESHSTTKLHQARLTSVHEVLTQEDHVHRRRLVVEVAPGVVDASAVALPSVIPDEESDCDASVPVFGPSDSEEEDEWDALVKECDVRDPGGS